MDLFRSSASGRRPHRSTETESSTGNGHAAMKEHLHHILLACAIGASSPVLAQSSLDIMLPEQIYGRVQVLDGSTIEFLNPRQPVRIAGYLAPRLEQNANT